MKKTLLLLPCIFLVALLSVNVVIGQSGEYFTFLPVISGGTEVPPPPPPTFGVSVQPNYSYRVSEFSSYDWIYGEVVNNTATSIYLVRVIANLYGTSGNLIQSGYSFVDLDGLPPGEKACFSILVDRPAEPVVDVTFDSPTYHVDDYHQFGLNILESSSTYVQYLGYSITGTVQNQFQQSLDYVQVSLTGYSNEGKVIACDYTYIDNSIGESQLAPGETGTFSIDVYYLEPGTLANYEIKSSGNLP